MAMLNAEWLNLNAGRAYPFQEDMGRRPLVGGLPSDAYRLPNAAVLDLAVAINSEDCPQIYLSAFTLACSSGFATATAAIARASDGEGLASVSATVPLADGPWHTPVNFKGSGNHDDLRGTIVFGDLARVADSIPDGVYLFDPGETLLEARCVRPSVPCVSGLYLTDPAGTYETARLRGDVALMAGANVRLEFDEADNAIVIHADARRAYNDECDCAFKDSRTVLKSVNGISVYDLQITGDGECVEVSSETGRIKISDKCSKPCCGCAELTFLSQKTNEIVTAVSRLDGFSRQLESRLNEFVGHALLSMRSSVSYV